MSEQDNIDRVRDIIEKVGVIRRPDCARRTLDAVLTCAGFRRVTEEIGSRATT
jgi:hypothetical protein